MHGLLHSEPAQEFLNAFVFWDSKRPVTVGLLGRLDLLAVAREVGAEDELCGFLHDQDLTAVPESVQQGKMPV